MPRIAAALAVFAVSAFCIGLNMVRYPVVWERVTARDLPAESAEPSESTPALEPAGDVVDWAPVESSQETGDSERDSQVVAAISSKPDPEPWEEESWDYAAEDPQPAVAGSYASGEPKSSHEPDAWDTPAGDTTTCTDGQCRVDATGDDRASPYDDPSGYDREPEANSTLVPVKRPGARRAVSSLRAGQPIDNWQAAGSEPAADKNVRRLPAVSPDRAKQTALARPPLSWESIPIYPTTGAE